MCPPRHSPPRLVHFGPILRPGAACRERVVWVLGVEWLVHPGPLPLVRLIEEVAAVFEGDLHRAGPAALLAAAGAAALPAVPPLEHVLIPLPVPRRLWIVVLMSGYPR